MDQLQVVGLALPGTAVAHATLTGSRRLMVVTKSGGFGTADTLAQIDNIIHNS
ncbi:hypothetical protein [Paracoccus tibetensis]|uniref:hypothetical protein n=1 Tax=Paracoccus tibetensis TaxID=336292 RepID=UPI003CCBF7D9